MADAERGSEPTSGLPMAVYKALVDTNVLLDLVLAREPWLSQAQSMWEERDKGRLEVCIAASILTDVFYICRKLVGTERARQAVAACLQGFSIVTLDHGILSAALALAGTDFEDNVQIACAQAAGIDFIVTRNTDDFALSPVPALDPQAVSSHLSSS